MRVNNVKIYFRTPAHSGHYNRRVCASVLKIPVKWLSMMMKYLCRTSAHSRHCNRRLWATVLKNVLKYM